MKRIYIVVGELEDTNEVDSFDSAHLTMDKADERCAELEALDDSHIWYWREVILEED